MKKNTISMIICGVLSLAFLVGGILSLMARDQKRIENTAEIQNLQQQHDQLTQESPKNEVDMLQNGNELLQMDIETLERECADLDTQNQTLQQEYEKLSEDENNIYYMTILEELQKGMKKVEGYINDAQ